MTDTMTRSQYNEALEKSRKQARVTEHEEDIRRYSQEYDELVDLRQRLRALHVSHLGKAGAATIGTAVDNLNYEVNEARGGMERLQRSLDTLNGTKETDPDDV